MRRPRLSLVFGACGWLLSLSSPPPAVATTTATPTTATTSALSFRDRLSAAAHKLRQHSGSSGGGGSSRASVAWAAYERRKSELERHPDDARLQLDTAEALLTWVRHTTNGNFPKASTGRVCEGDTPESRRIWRKHAPEALRLLKCGSKHALGSGDYDRAKYRFLHAEASTYLSSAKGILRAALQADAVTFKRNVRPLIDDHPAYQGGVGHTFMGAFYLAAPWPVHDLAKAEAHFDAALKIDSRCRRNHYCRGLVALELGDTAGARACFQRAVKYHPTSPEEEEVGDFFLKESRGALRALEKRDSDGEGGGGGDGGGGSSAGGKGKVVASRLAADW